MDIQRKNRFNKLALYRKEDRKYKRGLERKRRAEIKRSVDIREHPEKINERKDFGLRETDLTARNRKKLFKSYGWKENEDSKDKKVKEKIRRTRNQFWHY